MRTEGRGLSRESSFTILSPRTSVLLWEQHHFAALPRLDQLKPGRKFVHWKRMGDDRPNIEAGFKEACQPVPGTEQATAR